MQTLDHDHLTLHIDAPPDAVYALVADVTRTLNSVRKSCGVPGWMVPLARAAGALFEAVNSLPGPGVEEPPGRRLGSVR